MNAEQLADVFDEWAENPNGGKMAAIAYRRCARLIREKTEPASTDEAASAWEWKEVARKAGVCMSCALGTPEPYGCVDCLNTGWASGTPPGFVRPFVGSWIP
jgi:hypothetical protein